MERRCLTSVFPAFTLKHKEDKMEISLESCVYAINPRRIIAIESYKVEGSALGYGGEQNPFSKDEPREDGTPRWYERHVIIHMTDDFNIDFKVKDNSEYEELRDKLASIVNG